MNEQEPSVALELLDPGHQDPGYWERFQDRVMWAGRPNLASRRRTRVTVEGVMLSWSGLVLPLAVAAAAVAVMLLPRSGTPEVEEIAGIEEVLAFSDAGAEPLPSFLHSDQIVDRNVILLAVEEQ